MLFQQRDEPGIKEPDDRVQQERDHHAEDQRLQNGAQRLQHGEKARQIRKNHDEQNADKNNSQRGQANFDILPVFMFLQCFYGSF